MFTCTRCDLEKEDGERSRVRGKPRCKTCYNAYMKSWREGRPKNPPTDADREWRKEYMREWREKNPDKDVMYRLTNADRANDQRRERTRRRRQALSDLKYVLGCSCGERDPRCLHFHHRDPGQKEFGIGNAVRSSSLIRLLTEAKKCDVMCANCHQKLHIREM